MDHDEHGPVEEAQPTQDVEESHVEQDGAAVRGEDDPWELPSGRRKYALDKQTGRSDVHHRGDKHQDRRWERHGKLREDRSSSAGGIKGELWRQQPQAHQQRRESTYAEHQHGGGPRQAPVPFTGIAGTCVQGDVLCDQHSSSWRLAA